MCEREGERVGENTEKKAVKLREIERYRNLIKIYSVLHYSFCKLLLYHLGTNLLI